MKPVLRKNYLSEQVLDMTHENRYNPGEMKNTGQNFPDASENTRRINNTERISDTNRRRSKNDEEAQINLLRENDLYERQDS